MKLNLINSLKLLKEYSTLYGHSAHRRRYLDRYPSQYFRNVKPKPKTNKKKSKKNKDETK